MYKIIETREVDKVDIDRKLSRDNVVSLYYQCALNNDDFDRNGLNCNFAIGDGVSSRTAFSLERLNDNREVISSYLDQLCDIEQAPSYTKLFFDAKGDRWTDEAMVVEMLVQMGIASNMITFLYSPQLWHLLPDGVPQVAKNIYWVKEKTRGLNAKEYTKIFGDYK